MIHFKVEVEHEKMIYIDRIIGNDSGTSRNKYDNNRSSNK